MNLKQTISDFLKPHVQKYLDADRQYKLVRCQIIRAEADLECLEIMRESDKIESKKKVIKRLERKRIRIDDSNGWVANILHPLAEAIQEHYKGYSYTIMGPFGLECETSIWVWPTKEDQEQNNLDSLYSLTCHPCILRTSTDDGRKLKGFKLFIKNYDKETKHKWPNKDASDLTLEKIMELAKKK